MAVEAHSLLRGGPFWGSPNGWRETWVWLAMVASEQGDKIRAVVGG